LTPLVPVFKMASSSMLVLHEEVQPWKIAAFMVIILGLCINLSGAC
jgi:drug/metabolite transporter (DMT)-like permease